GLALEGALAEHVIEREVDERRPGRRRDARMQRVADEPRDVAGALRGLGGLRDRRDERHVVDLLERALPPAQRRRATAERQEWAAVLERRRERAHPVRHARDRRERADARLPRRLGPALGGEGGALLVAQID